MIEGKALKPTENPKPDAVTGFNPDKRVDVNKQLGEVKSESKGFDPDKRVEIGEVDSRSIEENKGFDPDKRVEGEHIYYTTLDERIGRTPVDSINGTWTGDRGFSKFVPSDNTEKGRAAIAKLAEYGLDGIEYKNGEPDYSKCSVATVRIEGMTELRPKNFDKADAKLAEQWNNEKRDGRTDWIDKDVCDYRQANKLSWHERCDTKTMDLVHRDIHGNDTSVFIHSGGVAECKARDRKVSGFDE